MSEQNIDKKINVGVVDEPNDNNSGEDTLGIQKHADALTTFIKHTSTPMTIGIQGEWGSGKTSLLLSIRDELTNAEDKTKDKTEQKYKQIWINAWEHSLLSSPEESLLKIINEIISKMVEGSGDVGTKEKLNKTLNKIFTGGLRTAATIARGNAGKQVVDDLIGDESNSIKKLRKQLDDLSEKILEATSNKTEKIIIYVDDLDRIDPPDAVRILELLKNIFSISNCVFVLAIDYQVVVKGLKKKYGKMTEENEWEFRSFFDKIIQLPFMMPLGQYDVGNYVADLLKEIGFIDDDFSSEDKIDKIINYTIGANPRSLKRLVNSLTLIEIFSNPALYLENEEDETRDKLEDEQKEKKDKETTKDLLLFSLVCLQISYPKIYDVLLKKPDFFNWNEQLAFNVTEHAEHKDKEKFDENFEKVKDTKEFNDDWEQALYRICYVNPRYKARAKNISRLFSLIKDDLLAEHKNPEDKKVFIEEIIDQTVVTSIAVTDDTKSQTVKKHERQILDDPDEGWDFYFQHKSFDSRKYQDLRELVKYIDHDLQKYFKDYGFIYSKSMGATFYKDRTNKQSKIGSINVEINSQGEKSASMKLYRDPRQEYRKPLVEGLETHNALPKTNHRDVAWYKIMIPSKEIFENSKEHIHKLVKISAETFDLRKQNKKYRRDVEFKKTSAYNKKTKKWPSSNFEKYVGENYTYKLS